VASPELADSLVWRWYAPIKMDAERHSHKRHLLLKVFPQLYKDSQESLPIPVVFVVAKICAVYPCLCAGAPCSYSALPTPWKDGSAQPKGFQTFGTGIHMPKKGMARATTASASGNKPYSLTRHGGSHPSTHREHFYAQYH
jgi:hypothetical protein